jgi:hypothetical protein
MLVRLAEGKVLRTPGLNEVMLELTDNMTCPCNLENQPCVFHLGLLLLVIHWQWIVLGHLSKFVLVLVNVTTGTYILTFILFLDATEFCAAKGALLLGVGVIN